MTRAQPRLAPLAGLTLLAAVLRFALIGHQGLWYDEAYTAYLVRLSPGGMLGLLPHLESTPPLYYCVAWVWTHAFGDTAAGLRSLSALCGTLTVPVVWVAARWLLASEVAAVIAAALTACNPLLIWYSQEARSYEMLVLFSACTLAAFAYCRERPTTRSLALWAASSVLALLTHYYAVLVVVPEAIWLLWYHPRRRALWAAIAAIAAAAAALSPLLLAQTRSDNFRWIAQIPFAARAGQVLPLALIGTGAPARELLKYVAFAAVLIGAALLATRAERAPRRGAVVALGLCGAGLALSLLSALYRDTFLARNLLPLWIPAALALSAGLATVRARTLGLGAALALCAVGIVAVVGVDTERGLQRPDWPGVAAALGPSPSGSAQRIVIVQRIPGLLPLGIYMRGLRRARGVPLSRVAEIDVVAQRSTERGHYCWWGSACNLAGSDLQHAYAITGFSPAGPAARVNQFRILRLRAAHPRAVTVASIRRALTTTRLSNDAFLVQG